MLTYFDRLAGYCFVQDGTGGVRVELSPGQAPPAAGWRVRVSGMAASSGASPSVVEARVSPLAAGNFAAPPTVTGQKLRDPANQYRRVAVSGVLRSVSTERAGLMALEIQTQGVTVWAKIAVSPLEITDALVDADVLVTGVLSEDIGGAAAGAGVTLWVSGLPAISVAQTAPPPDALPFQRILPLSQMDRSRLPAHRVRVQGVSYLTVKKDLAVMDESGQIPVDMAHGGIPADGTRLDLAGFLTWERGRVVLKEAVPVRSMQPDPNGRRAGSSGILATALAVRELSRSEAQLGNPVHLRAVVTFFDPANGLLFVEDSSDGIFVELKDAQHPPLRAGDVVDVTGLTTADFAPNVGKAQVKVVGHASLPEPRTRALGVAITGTEDSRWIELPGVVQHVSQEPADSLLTLVWGRERYKAHVLAGADTLASLVDAEVRIRGVCGSLFNGKRQLLGIQLFVPGTQYIEVVRKAAADPFALPPTPVEDLMRFSAGQSERHRIRLRGVVTYAERDGMTWIRDATGGVMLQDLDPQPLAPGELVDVVGFPAISGFSAVLRGAELRRLAAGGPPVPVRIDPEGAMKGDFDGQFVEIEGKLIDQLRQPSDHILAMESSGTVFDADLPGGMAAPALEPGMLLRLTGICTVAVEQSHDLILPRGFRILLRSPADISVLRRPSLLTPERVAPVLGGATLIMGGALVWAALLRKRVGKQTHALRTQTMQLQNAHQRTRDALRKVSDAESLHRESNGILELIARDAPVDAIADRVAESLAMNLEGAVCAVLLADRNKLRVLAVPALPAGWLETLRHLDIGTISFSTEFRAPKELSDDPLWAEFIASQPAARFRTFCASPIVVDGVTAGAITAFFRSEHPAADAPGVHLAAWCNMAALALDRRRLHDQLSYRAQHDVLTGLPNRDLLYQRLEEEIAAASRGDGLLGLLYVDLDGFKKVNDTYGHDAGDAVLRQAAQRMTHGVRRGDTVARIGGDEFVVLLPRLTRKQDAELIAAKLAAALTEPVYAQRQKLAVSASVGIGIWPMDGDEPDHLMRFADAQMYGQKRRRWYENSASRAEEPKVPTVPEAHAN